MSMASANTLPPPSTRATSSSRYGSGARSKIREIPWRSSTSTSNTRLPVEASASASEVATVVLPVPPFPET